MTRLLSESFDRWVSATQMQTSGYWTAATAFTAVTGPTPTTEFGVGQAARAFTGNKTFLTAANEATVFGTFRFKWDSASPATTAYSILLRDDTTDQVCLQILGNGNVVVRTGGVAGSILTTATAAFTVNTWHSFQFKAVIGAAGSFEVRLNGSTSPFINLTGVNTRGGGVNDYCNNARFVHSGSSQILDDILLVNDDGTAPAGWTGDVRVVQQLPALSPVSAWDRVGPVRTFGTTAVTVNQATNANTLMLQQITATRPGLVLKGTINLNAGATGNVRMAIYEDNAGVPGALVTTASAVVNPSAGENDFTFAAPPTLLIGDVRWIGILADVNLTLKGVSGTSTRQTQAVTYGDGFPDPAATSTAGSVFQSTVFLTLTSSNATELAETAGDSDTSYVFATAAQTDEFTFHALGATPSAILFCLAYAQVRKTDAGSITLNLGLDNTATSGGSATVITTSSLATTYDYIEHFYTTQADGTTPLTLAAVNSVEMILGVP